MQSKASYCHLFFFLSNCDSGSSDGGFLMWFLTAFEQKSYSWSCSIVAL